MNINHHLETAAAIGSPTAAALLAQINQEAAEAEATRRGEEIEAASKERTRRAELISTLQQTISTSLDQYDAARLQVTQSLLAAHRAAARLPSGVLPLRPINHLSTVHVPPATLGPLDPIHPTFPSLTVDLMAVGLR